jgi:hypothetical protein
MMKKNGEFVITELWQLQTINNNKPALNNELEVQVCDANEA